MANSRKLPKGITFETKEGNVAEGYVVTDEFVRDPNSPLAVQIPEGVGADGPADDGPVSRFATLAEGHVEAKFGTTAAPLPARSDTNADDEHTRAVGEDSGDDFEPALEAEPVGPEYVSEPKATDATNHEYVTGRDKEVEEAAAKEEKKD